MKISKNEAIGISVAVIVALGFTIFYECIFTEEKDFKLSPILDAITLIFTCYIFIFGLFNFSFFGRKYIVLHNYKCSGKWYGYSIPKLVTMLLYCLIIILVYPMAYSMIDNNTPKFILTFLLFLIIYPFTILLANIYSLIVNYYYFSHLEGTNINNDNDFKILNRIGYPALKNIFLDYYMPISSADFIDICKLFDYVYSTDKCKIFYNDSIEEIKQIIDDKVSNLQSYKDSRSESGQINTTESKLNLDFLIYISSTYVIQVKDNITGTTINDYHRISINNYNLFHDLICNLKDEVIYFLVALDLNIFNFEYTFSKEINTQKEYYSILYDQYVKRSLEDYNISSILRYEHSKIKSNVQISEYLLALVINGANIEASNFLDNYYTDLSDPLIFRKKLIIFEKILYNIYIIIEDSKSTNPYPKDNYNSYIKLLNGYSFVGNLNIDTQTDFESYVDLVNQLDKTQNEFIDMRDFQSYALRTYSANLYYSRIITNYVYIIFVHIERQLKSIKTANPTNKEDVISSFNIVLNKLNILLDTQNSKYFTYISENDNTYNEQDYFILTSSNQSNTYIKKITEHIDAILIQFKNDKKFLSDLIKRIKFDYPNLSNYYYLDELLENNISFDDNVVNELFANLTDDKNQNILKGRENDYAKKIDELIKKINESKDEFIKINSNLYMKNNLINYFRKLLDISVDVFLEKISSINDKNLVIRQIGNTYKSYITEYNKYVDFFSENGIFEKDNLEFQDGLINYLENTSDNINDNDKTDIINILSQEAILNSDYILMSVKYDYIFEKFGKNIIEEFLKESYYNYEKLSDYKEENYIQFCEQVANENNYTITLSYIIKSISYLYYVYDRISRDGIENLFFKSTKNTNVIKILNAQILLIHSIITVFKSNIDNTKIAATIQEMLDVYDSIEKIETIHNKKIDSTDSEEIDYANLLECSKYLQEITMLFKIPKEKLLDLK